MNIKIKKGLDIKLLGEAKAETTALSSDTYAVKPTDFHGVIPKMEVKPGDEVKAGSPLFHDKYDNSIKFCSPVSGEVAEVRRGDKRKILEVIVLADKEIRYEDFKVEDPKSLDAEAVKNKLKASGAWALIKKRPYDVIARPSENPKAIFILGFDSSPLAPDYGYVLEGQANNLQAGIDALSKLTAGKLHLSLHSAKKAGELDKLSGVEKHQVSGPHPSGNAAVQIQHISPLNKGEVVWVVNALDLVTIGKLFTEGKYDPVKVFALTGPKAKNPRYFKAQSGVQLKAFQSEIEETKTRLVSGNLLTGDRVNTDSYLGHYHYQLTALEEGDEREFFGWISPGLNKFSASRSFLSTWLSPNKARNIDTHQHGEERAFVVTGQYEKVFPLDVYPVQLLKSILVEDIELMENLGIYEVAPEDFALCEVVCTSKINSQEIVRNGLDLMIKEMS